MMLAPRAWLDRYAPPAAAGAVLLAAWEYLPSSFGVPVLLMPPPRRSPGRCGPRKNAGSSSRMP